MARRRVWSALSSDYRARLLRKGITQQAYESGVSLKAARGHSQTPEHPEDAIKFPNRYQVYRGKLKKLQAEVVKRKELIWGNRFKYEHHRAKANVLRGVPPDFSKPGIRTLQRMMDASDQDWEYHVVQASYNLANGIEDDWAALLYH